jgi:hypothetical protein
MNELAGNPCSSTSTGASAGPATQVAERVVLCGVQGMCPDAQRRGAGPRASAGSLNRGRADLFAVLVDGYGHDADGDAAAGDLHLRWAGDDRAIGWGRDFRRWDQHRDFDLAGIGLAQGRSGHDLARIDGMRFLKRLRGQRRCA